MGIVDFAALVVGYALLTIVASAIVSAAVLLAWVYFPVEVTLITQRKREKNGHPGTARMDWRTASGFFNEVPVMVGLSSRRKSRWFFGVVLFGKAGHDDDLRHPKIITRASQAQSGHAAAEPRSLLKNPNPERETG